MPAAVADTPSISLSCKLILSTLTALFLKLRLTVVLVANNFWGKDDAGVLPMLERMHNAKSTCDELRSFYSSELPSFKKEYLG